MARAPPAAMSMSWRSMGLVSSVFKGAYYFVDESGLGRTWVFGAAGCFAGFAFGGCLGLLWGTVAAAVLEVGLELLLHFQALFLGLVATGCQYPQGELVLLAVRQLELDFDFVVWHGVGFVGIKYRIFGPRISRICTNFLIARIGFTNLSTNFTNWHELKCSGAHFSERRVGEGVLGDGGRWRMRMLGLMEGCIGRVYRFFLRGVGMEWLVFLGRF